MLVAGAFPQVQVCVSAYVCLGERIMIIKIITNKITIIITIRNSDMAYYRYFFGRLGCQGHLL